MEPHSLKVAVSIGVFLVDQLSVRRNTKSLTETQRHREKNL